MPRDNRLYSGFVLHDYVLTFQLASPESRQKLVELCAGPWLGDQVTPTTWEVSNTLSPDEMERTLLDIMEDGDRVVYYYLSDSKRVFRVVLE
jgi:hypothetical protein